MIYRISTNNDKYMIFHIEPKELRSKMGDDMMIHMGAEPDKYLDHWVKPDATFYISNNFPKALKIPDITLWGEFLVLNEKAYSALSARLSEYGEYLPVNCEGNNYYIFNILKIMDNSVAVDEEQSVRKVENDIFLGVDKLVFKEDVMGDTLVFRTAFDDHQRVFCTTQFKQLIENIKLDGITFKTDLEGLN